MMRRCRRARSTPLPRSATAHLALWLMIVAPPGLPAAFAAPRGEEVASGAVEFERSGADTVIRASDGSIIDWHGGFDIQSGETVRFIQPHELARVMNRDRSGDPTLMNGSMRANGIVYVVNPYGVFFGQQALVDAAGLVAAAGELSNENFLRGVDRFDHLSGAVEVAAGGLVRANTVGMIGQSVANHGQIVSPGGLIALVAGERVLLTSPGDHIIVEVEGGVKIRTLEEKDGAGCGPRPIPSRRREHRPPRRWKR